MRGIWGFVHRVGALALLVVLGVVASPSKGAPAPEVGGEPTRSSVAGGAVIEGRAEMPIGHYVLGPGRRLPVTIEGLDQATLRLFRVPAALAHHVRPILGVHQSKQSPLAELPLGTVRDEARVVVQPEGPTYAESEILVDVFARVQGDLALAVLEAPDMTRIALVERGRLAVVLKKGLGKGIVWVADTMKAKPAEGADVTLRQGSTVRFNGKTDARGVVAIPPEDALRLPFDGRERDSYEPLTVVVEHRGRSALGSESWSTGLEPWAFGIPAAYYSAKREHTGMVTAERGIYRPGESMHVFGVLRRRSAAGALSVPVGETELTVRAPDGSSAFQGSVRLTSFGTFQVTVPLGRHAALGTYGITARRGATTLHGSFEVGEYRTARFEVDVEASDDADGTQMGVAARYLYGAAVKGADVAWSASVRQGRGPNDGFEYGPEDRDFGYLTPVASGKGTTDGEGRLTARLEAAALPDEAALPAQILDVVREATVTDLAGDTITAARVATRLRTPAVVGVRTNDWVVDPAKGWSVDLKAADAEGAAKAGQAIAVEVVRRHWATVAKVSRGRTVYDGGWHETVVLEKTVTSGRSPKKLKVELPGGGTYRLRARVPGHRAYAETSVWAWGGGAYGGGSDDDARVEVRASKSRYAPGDEARLLVGSPYAEALALVTVEQDGVLFAEPRRLRSGEDVRLRVKEAYLPGAHASVALLPVGLAKSAPAAGIPFRMGYAKLAVSAEARRLSVTVTPDEDEHRPGDRAAAAVRVRDEKGRPVRAEVTLWAADEGVLMLTGYQTPSVFGAVYEERPLGVFTSTNLVRWYQPGGDYDDGSGGDYGEEGSAFRSRFLSTAFFAKPVVTDAEGRATVEFELPDNLTRWRLMASATDERDRFGAAEASIVTRKPVQAMPALPRFLTRGDRANATVLVDNQSGRSGIAVVTLDVDGARLDGPREQRVPVEAGSQVAVPFSVVADRVGTVTVSAEVRLGHEHDAFRVALPAHPPTAWQSAAVSSGKVGARATIALQLPPDATPAESEVVIDVSASVLSGMTGAIDALLDYPNGCVEQTTSRLIPLVQLERILEKTGDPRLSSSEHRRRMGDGIAHVIRHQNADGGFGLWPSSDSESFLTAYALWGLETAERAGYEVPARVAKRGFRYLKAHLGEDHDMHGQFSDEETAPFAAYVLARAGQGGGELSAAAARGASRFSLGLLGVAAVGAKSAGLDLDGTLAGLVAAARPQPRGGALVKERAGGGSLFAMGRDVRASATAVEALLAAGRATDAEQLAQGLLAARAADGSWGTTYNNLWALNALAAYATAELERAAPSAVAVDHGGRRAAEVTVSSEQPLRRVVLPGSAVFGKTRKASLSLVGKGGGDVRYAARLRWVPDVTRQRATQRGLSVQRRMVDADTGKAVSEPRVGQLLRIVLTVDASAAGRQIAVMDHLPAGLEAVDTALRTSGHGGQTERRDWYWSHRELHDERVTFFANYLPRGSHHVSYLARATRPGTFVRPAMRAEAMYDPDVFGAGTAERVVVRR